MIDLPTESEPVRILEGDCLEWLPRLPDSSVDLIATDPPYFKVKVESWDRQWATDGDYLAWLGTVVDEWKRVLKPNGSLFCFASPRMAWEVEGVIRERMSVLNCIRWLKDEGWAKRQCKEEQRAFFPASESIIFAEHYGADNMAKGEAGYAAKCDELRGFVFEPLRKYFDDERKLCGIANDEIMDGMEARGVGRYMFVRHTFSRSQWQLPTREQYEAARSLFNTKGGDYLRREYEDLRREYEDLRRPFSVSSSVPYTDVWTFPTVRARKGKHPCEKPRQMMRHIVRSSSRPGAMVLDCFAGSGTTAVACIAENRRCILIEKEPAYADIARRRVAEAMGTGLLAGAT